MEHARKSDFVIVTNTCYSYTDHLQCAPTQTTTASVEIAMIFLSPFLFSCHHYSCFRNCKKKLSSENRNFDKVIFFLRAGVENATLKFRKRFELPAKPKTVLQRQISTLLLEVSTCKSPSSKGWRSWVENRRQGRSTSAPQLVSKPNKPLTFR